MTDYKIQEKIIKKLKNYNADELIGALTSVLSIKEFNTLIIKVFKKHNRLIFGKKVTDRIIRGSE